jgi:hypothetical protein
MLFQPLKLISAVILISVLLLCLPVGVYPMCLGGSSFEIITDIDVCDGDPPEVLHGYLSVTEDFYSLLNFPAVGFLVGKTQKNAAIALACRLERPPAR